jgi:hypothetical protein
MTKLSAEWAIFSVILITMMLTAASISADLVLAVKKTVKTVPKTHTVTTTTTTKAVHHVKGVRSSCSYRAVKGSRW